MDQKEQYVLGLCVDHCSKEPLANKNFKRFFFLYSANQNTLCFMMRGQENMHSFFFFKKNPYFYTNVYLSCKILVQFAQFIRICSYFRHSKIVFPVYAMKRNILMLNNFQKSYLQRFCSNGSDDTIVIIIMIDAMQW